MSIEILYSFLWCSNFDGNLLELQVNNIVLVVPCSKQMPSYTRTRAKFSSEPKVSFKLQEEEYFMCLIYFYL